MVFCFSHLRKKNVLKTVIIVEESTFKCIKTCKDCQEWCTVVGHQCEKQAATRKMRMFLKGAQWFCSHVIKVFLSLYRRQIPIGLDMAVCYF